MPHKSTLAQPELVGRLDPGIFVALQGQLPNSSTEITWRSSSNEPNKNPDLFDILKPLHDIVLSREAASRGEEVAAIAYTVDTKRLSPFGAQRGNHWHIDGPPAYVVADAMSTEFMVGKSRFAIARNIAGLKLIQWVKDPHPTEDIRDEQLPQFNTSIFCPKPFEVVRMLSNIHRSPLNRSLEIVERTWVRAAVYHNGER